ncbi:MAG: radical SAM protein [Nitrospirae bacterium]|nr:radical SAM protein [Nitrospirota bacterium]
MKILCLNPPFKTEHGRYSRSSRSPAITKSGTLYYPIWLCYAAIGLEDAGHEVKIIDACAYEYGLIETLEIVIDFQPDLVIIDTSTASIYNDVMVGASIKERLTDCYIALMGTHPSALPEETLLLNTTIDAVIVGEADRTVVELAEKLYDKSFKDIEGLAYRENGQIVINKRREAITDLDLLPFVSKAYHKHLDINKYFFAASDYPEVQIITARGCVARCTFCVYPQTIHGTGYRMRSSINVADEFEWIVTNMPQVRQIGIEDDTFTGDQRRVIDICNEIIRRKIKIKWYCNVRVNLSLETMEWMKRAGCVLITVGYESADDEVLRNINKKITRDMIIEFSKNAKESGLLVHGCFMAGNRGESRETLEKNLDLALRLNDDTMQFFPLMAYPGTKDYQWALDEGLLTISSYSDYLTQDGNHNSVLKMPDMSSDEIRQWCNYARKRYYLRFNYMMYKLIQQIKTPSEIRRTFKSARRFLRYLLRG